jgi:murein DD-endopeptidase MepM/ murein hydrolase activator NlpD
LAGSTDAPTVGKVFIRPTRGIITQGYKRGHYALDIADASKPPVWAAGSGTVIKASSGTWGGGYGNHVIIDHGNGMQTLYAHLDYLDVSNGDYVSQGAVIGRMGRTGRVYGRTGIHLHFEVRKNGVKQNPAAYY